MGRKERTNTIYWHSHPSKCQHFPSGVLLPRCKAAGTWLQGLTKMSAKNQNFFDKNPGRASSQGGEGGLTAGTALQFPVSGFPGSTNFSQWLDPVIENPFVHLYSLKVTLVTLPLPPALLSTQPCHSTSRNMYFYGWVRIFWKEWMMERWQQAGVGNPSGLSLFQATAVTQSHCTTDLWEQEKQQKLL